MSHISQPLKTRYAAVSKDATATIHRHPQADMATELLSLSNAVNASDQRDSYGVGGTINQFEQQLCELFNKPASVFLPTGTLAQCAAMKCYCEAAGKTSIGLHPTSHLLLHEHMAIEELWGLNAVMIGDPQRTVSCHDVTSLDPSSTSAIIIELPMREIGGALPSWDDLVDIRNWCDANNVKMHMDGARVWQAPHYYGRSLPEIAAIFDSLYVSFYKDLGGVFGAALLAEEALVKDARVWARRAGGNPITQYPEVIAARSGLETYLEKMPLYVKYTKALCEHLRPLPLNLLPDQPEASMFHLKFRQSPQELARRIVEYAEETGIVVLPLPRSGDQASCICEITVGDNTLAQTPVFWSDHINACLTR